MNHGSLQASGDTRKVIYQLSAVCGVVMSMLRELIVAACGSPKMDRPTNANRAQLDR
jgi:hypothetical protein